MNSSGTTSHSMQAVAHAITPKQSPLAPKGLFYISQEDAGNPSSVLYWWNQYIVLSRSSSPLRCLQLTKQLEVSPSSLVFLIEQIQVLTISQRPNKISLCTTSTVASPNAHSGGLEEEGRDPASSLLYSLTLKLFELCQHSLTSLDLRPTVGIGGNKSLDIHRAAFQSLEHLEHLNELHIDMDGLIPRNQTDEDDDEDMDEDLQDDRDLQEEPEEVDQNLVVWNPLTQALAKPNCQLRSLSIDNANDLDFLEPALRQYSRLKKLELTNCSSHEDFDSIHGALRATPSRLHHLSLQGMGLHIEELPAVVSLLGLQQELRTLDLSFNAYLLETTNEDGDYVLDASVIDPFVQAISHHPTLQVLNLDNCRLHADILVSLLSAISNLDSSCHNLTELVFCDQSFVYFIGIEEGWVACIGGLNLRKFYGLQRLFQRQEEWQAKVVPALRKNTTLEELHHASNQRMYPLDRETSRILKRNKLLRLTQGYRQKQGTPALAVWPRLLECMASPKVEASALYTFLCQKSAELHKDSSSVGHKRAPVEQRMDMD